MNRAAVRVSVAILLSLLTLASLAIAQTCKPLAHTLDVSPAVVLAHDQGDFLPGLPTALMKRVQERGYGIYRLDARANTFPNYRQELWQMFGAACDTSGICWFEDWTVGATEYDLLWSLPDTWPWGSNVAGLAFYTLYPARIEINWRLPYSSFRTTNSHECGHACDGQEDQYFHPLTCAVLRVWTRMSCGTLVASLTAYDRDIVWNVYLPDFPSNASVVRTSFELTVFYNGIRRSSVGCTLFSGTALLGNNPSEADNVCGHYSRFLDNVTRVSVWYRDDGGDWIWTGEYGPRPALSDSFTAYSFWTPMWCPPDVNRQWSVHMESALEITWPTFVGGVPQLSGELQVIGAC